MRRSGILVVLILLVGCGKNRPWPAAVVSMQGFSAAQQQNVQTALDSLNQHVGHSVILAQDSNQTENYPITLQYGTPNGAGEPNLAGLATVATDNCTIQLSPVLFDGSHNDDLMPVVWHEIGHCAGLVHVPTPGEIMYPSTTPFGNYSQTELSNYYASLIKSSGLINQFSSPTASPTPTQAP